MQVLVAVSLYLSTVNKVQRIVWNQRKIRVEQELKQGRTSERMSLINT